MRTLSFALVVGAAVLLGPTPAPAFTTRVHIVIANRLREAALSRGDGAVPLRLSPYAARLSKEDLEALRAHPLAFRAGAVGPDNMAFPGMTDPSHAIEQRPFEQCELLYDLALTAEERAYAMGCFLHGATDATAHHYVNYMSGETFTLTPIKTARQTSYGNVVRHILAESMIQRAVLRLDPDAFRQGQLLHTIPTSFVLRAYLDERSPLWQMMARRAKEKFDAQVAKTPDASLPQLLASLDLAPADHLVLTPVYLRSADAVRTRVRADLQAAIAAMQDPRTPDGAQLKVQPGADGKLGTSDDKTACAAGCAALYARYFVYVALLAPRFDAGNRPLPSAFDKISDKLRQDLFQFLPAYLQTVENLSAKLNAPLGTTTDDFADLNAAEISRLFAPLDAWVNNLTTIDYETVARAVTPDWLLALQDALSSVGVNISISNILRAALQPIVQPIRDAVRDYAIHEAKKFLGDLADEYRRDLKAVTLEYEERLRAAAPEGLGLTSLDRFFDSGLFAHGYNFTAATLANHAAALPVGEDPVGVGPASFDASYTMAWSQLGLCGYLRRAVFPLGIDVRGTLSLREGDRDLAARVAQDSPVECHDGSLSAFTSAPHEAACRLTDVPRLVADPAHRGSVTRAFPPELGEKRPTCQNIEVPGLPAPERSMEEEAAPTGCSCQVGGRAETGTGGAALVLVLAALIGLLRRRRAALPLLGLLGGASGCGPADMGMDMTPDAEPPADMGPSRRQTLLDALHRTVWSGMQKRGGVERAYELQFDARSFLWAEIQNPYGPSRRRELRSFTIDDDGERAHSTVISPLTWPDARDIGRQDDWRIELLPGTPRRLRLTRGGTIEEYAEGAMPAPTGGLTATVRVFPAGGVVDKAFCSSGANGFKYDAFFSFARGRSGEPLLGVDTVAGARLLRWRDASGRNRFAITDVHGFDLNGGTELSDQYNFFVTYRGTVRHPGGIFQMRELDDKVEDGVWVFLGDKVGSNSTADLFFEVHGFIWGDDETVSRNLGAGDIPIEIIVARCAKQITDVDVLLKQGTGPERLVGEAESRPIIDEALFPPAL